MIKKLFLIAGVGTLIACVPARKFDELKNKHKSCSEDLESTKAKNAELETLTTEQKAQIDDMKDNVTRLKADTTLLGKSLRMKERQYDKIDALNQRIQEQLEALQRGSQIENNRLSGDLEATRLELQRKEDELRKLEMELNIKSRELENREKRVKELEAIIAQKDQAVKLLKEKVAGALLGFKDKGLTVEQRNGRVYVSMEAKLLFASGSTQVNSEGQKALVQLAKVLEDQIDLDVLVEGHTDTDKMKSSAHPKDNWELSVLRATSVVKIMLDKSKMEPKTITAAGRSEYLPVDKYDKAKNRRIEIILIPNLDELFSIISN